MQFSSIWPIDRTLSGATTSDQSGPGSDGIERELCIPEFSSNTETSQSDCLVSYPGQSLVGGKVYPTVEKQSLYSTAPADWAKITKAVIRGDLIVMNFDKILQTFSLLICVFLMFFWFKILREFLARWKYS